MIFTVESLFYYLAITEVAEGIFLIEAQKVKVISMWIWVKEGGYKGNSFFAIITINFFTGTG